MSITTVLPLWFELFIFFSVVFFLILQKHLKKKYADHGLKWHPEEKTYIDPKTNQKLFFPSITDEGSLYLTVVVPAYNEERRLGKMLDETLQHLNERKSKDPNFTYEIIIVDDGSRDGTSRLVQDYALREGTESIRLLKLVQNRGKGGAIRRGVMCGRGRYVLFADADGATQFSDLDKLEIRLRAVESVERNGIAVGSRAHNNDQNNSPQVKNSILRRIFSWTFHTLVDVLCVKGVKDTQCGFKLLTRKSAYTLFKPLHIERFAFDVELLFLAQQMGYPIVEVPVTWTEIEGSTVSPVADGIRMAKDLIRIRFMYLIGAWTTITMTSNPVDRLHEA
eukprot:TRINITY_DN8754_c0_g1_i1.p1 TRINITY_DN8754_c0_g1~~TRINITY_DN8754_c0_g1_i1.p1  ORF type:complete len:336 (+),score=121.22 TRINITY_DN8754_c0_g1_i1:123-1130(+)